MTLRAVLVVWSLPMFWLPASLKTWLWQAAVVFLAALWVFCEEDTVQNSAATVYQLRGRNYFVGLKKKLFMSCFFFFCLELLLFRYWTYWSGPLIFLPFSPVIHLLVLLFHFWWSSSFSPSVILVSPWHRHFHICQAVFQLLTPTTLGWDLSVPMTLSCSCE